MGIAALLSAAPLACGSNQYVEPSAGPTATITVASTCIERATFFARINGLRTAALGCNQTARWLVVPGPVDLVVQVQQASFVVDPLSVQFDISEGQCAGFLLRQADGYDLEFFGVGDCPD